MTVRKWRPLGDLVDIHDRITRLFEGDFLPGGKKPADGLPVGFPVTDIFETKEGYVFRIEIPGVPREDIQIEIVNNILTIKGQKKEQSEIRKENYYRMESHNGPFSRTFHLPRDVEPDKIDAVLRDGILELKIARIEGTQSKFIPIKTK